jgi:hypothetical protein
MRIKASPLIKHSYPLALFLITTLALAHGEDKPGPHGGYIRMPGAFHTEVVPNGNEELKVFLLDINWKNPLTKNSSVQLSLGKKGKGKISCHPKDDAYFSCPLPKGTNLNKKGEFFVEAQRDGFKGNKASYALPLSFAPPDEGTNHH